eukprot:1187358-Prorocentrum_minimum.AAC.2
MDNQMRLALGLPPNVNYGIYKDPALMSLLGGQHRKPKTAVPRRNRQSYTAMSLPNMPTTRCRPNTVEVSRAKQIVNILIAECPVSCGAPRSSPFPAFTTNPLIAEASITSLPEVQTRLTGVSSFKNPSEIKSRKSDSQGGKLRSTKLLTTGVVASSQKMRTTSVGAKIPDSPAGAPSHLRSTSYP